MALKYLNVDDIGSLFGVISTNIRKELKEELDVGRITKSEYGDTIKTLMNTFVGVIPNLYSLEFEIENKKLQNEILKTQLKLERQKLLNEQKQTKFLDRQIRSFDDKILIEMLGQANRSWGLILNSGLLDIAQDDNGNVTGTIPDYMTNDNIMEVYNELRRRAGAPNTDG